VTVPTPTGAARRDAIADAAIELVASRGLRGLTHRAVDSEAGLPPGSTSYYLRTRDALLAACVERMLQRDLASDRRPAATDLPGLLTELVTGQVAHRRTDLLARYELSLESVRRPELRASLLEAGARLRSMLAGLLEAHGVPDAASAAAAVAGMLDGLMYDRVAGAGSDRSDAEFEASVRRAVDALLTGLTGA